MSPRSWTSRVCLASLLIGLPLQSGQAGSGDAITPERWWAAWNWDPLILVNLCLVGWFYACGVRLLWRRAGGRRLIAPWQVAALGGSLGCLLLALVSPLHALGEQLSSAHMVQHILLMNVAAPLLMLAAPLVAFRWALPGPWRQWMGGLRTRLPARGRADGFPWQPAAAWTAYAAALWIWHHPVLYETALDSLFWHDLEHLTMFAASCLFWRVLLDPLARFRFSRGAGVVYLFTTSLHATILGVLMTLSPTLWYPVFEGRTAAWNLTPLEDQQLAGLIMWMPGCAVYAVAAAWMLVRWLQETEGDHPERDSALPDLSRTPIVATEARRTAPSAALVSLASPVPPGSGGSVQ